MSLRRSADSNLNPLPSDEGSAIPLPARSQTWPPATPWLETTGRHRLSRQDADGSQSYASADHKNQARLLSLGGGYLLDQQHQCPRGLTRREWAVLRRPLRRP